MASKIVVNLDTSKENYIVAKSKQNDDLTLEANIFENGVIKDLTNSSIVIQSKKADNTYIIQNTDITKEKNKFIANLVRDFTRVAGKTEIEVVLTESSKQNTTFSFVLEVIGSVIRGAEKSKDLITSFEIMQDAVVEMGKISEETKELIKNSGAATKEEINKVNAQLADIANKGTTVEVLERVTKQEIERQIANGTMTNLAIAPGSITQDKLSPNIEFGVKDGEITPNKLANTDYNIYENITIIDDTIVNFGSGNTSTLNGYECTDFIQINNGDIIKIADGKISKLAVIYNSSKKAIQDISGASTNGEFVLTINKENASYIRININKSSPYYSNFYIKKPIEKCKVSWIEVGLSNLDSQLGSTFDNNGKINPESIVGSKGALNLFKKNNCIANKVINNAGVVANAPNTSNTYYVTDFIEVTSGANATFNWDSVNTFCAEYDINKKFIKIHMGNIGGMSRVISLSDNTAYIRVNVKNDVLDTFDIRVGEKLTFDWLEDLLDDKFKNFNVDNNCITNNYIHMSFDDVSTCITDIISNKDKYTSIFDNVFLNFIKQLHNKYGTVFSLYLYNINNLLNFPDKFKDDFIKSNKWLKFGLHAKDSGTNYGNATAQQGKDDWNLFITQMYRISGGYGSIDRIPRLHTFAGSKQCLTAMRDCDCGALGFLSADDSRNTYYLNSTQKEYLRTHDKLEDIENGLIFFSTDLRLDWFNSGFSSDNQYNKPVKNTPYEELVYRYGQPMMGDCYHSLIIFTHEWEIYGGSGLNSKKSRVEDVCKFGVDYGYSFDFPQNRTNGGITSLKLAFDTIKSLLVE